MNWLIPALTDYAWLSAVVVGFLTAFVIAFTVVGVTATRLPSFEGMHWTEKARLLAPLTGGRSLLYLIMLYLSWGAGTSWLFTPFGLGYGGVLTGPGAVGIILGTLVGADFVDAEGRWRFLGVRKRLLEDLKALVLNPHMIVFVLGLSFAISALYFSVPLAFWIYGLTFVLCLLALAQLHVPVLFGIGIFTPLAGPLRGRVDALCDEKGWERPRLGVVNIAMANALAYYWRKTIILTSRAMEALDEDEQCAVICHELGHLQERFSQKAARMLSPVTLFAMPVAVTIAVELGMESADASGAAMLILGSTYISGLKLSRHLERQADQHAVESATSAEIYARALERIYECNLIPAVTKHAATHPSLYDRMLAAGVTPGYERPEPPRDDHVSIAVLLGALLLIPIGVDYGLDAALAKWVAPQAVVDSFAGLDDDANDWRYAEVAEKLRKKGQFAAAYYAADLCMDRFEDSEECYDKWLDLIYEGANCDALRDYLVVWISDDGEESLPDYLAGIDDAVANSCGIKRDDILAQVRFQAGNGS